MQKLLLFAILSAWVLCAFPLEGIASPLFSAHAGNGDELPSGRILIEKSQGGTTYPSPGIYQRHSGSSFIVSARPSTGFTLSGWVFGPHFLQPDNPIELTVPEEITYTLRPVFGKTPEEPQFVVLLLQNRLFKDFAWALFSCSESDGSIKRIAFDERNTSLQSCFDGITLAVKGLDPYPGAFPSGLRGNVCWEPLSASSGSLASPRSVLVEYLRHLPDYRLVFAWISKTD